MKPKAEGREPDRLKGLPELPDSVFFDPLPEEELRLWEGHGPDPNDADWDPTKRAGCSSTPTSMPGGCETTATSPAGRLPP